MASIVDLWALHKYIHTQLSMHNKHIYTYTPRKRNLLKNHCICFFLPSLNPTSSVITATKTVAQADEESLKGQKEKISHHST